MVMSFDVSGNVMDTATSPLSYLGSEIVAASFGASVTTTLVLVFKASATSLTDATSITFSLKAGEENAGVTITFTLPSTVSKLPVTFVL